MFSVYKVLSPTNKVYIGITSKTLEERKLQHFKLAKSGSRCAIHAAIRKYGHDLKWQVLEIVATKKEAFTREIHFIKQFDSQNTGYNLTKGGDGTFGRRMTREDIRKCSLAHTGKNEVWKDWHYEGAKQ